MLLLELPKSEPSYESGVFDSSLADCKFMDYSINTWQSTGSSSLFTMGTTSYSQDPLNQTISVGSTISSDRTGVARNQVETGVKLESISHLLFNHSLV